MEYEYVKKQEENIEKKYDKLREECRILKTRGEIERLKKKYEQLKKKKESGNLDLLDEIMMDVYQDAIKMEEKSIKWGLLSQYEVRTISGLFSFYLTILGDNVFCDLEKKQHSFEN